MTARRVNTFTAVMLLLLTIVPLSGMAQERVGLVLSGGGARGLAHIGVLRALEERGIGIDAVAGTSMGSIIGALYAMGLSPAQIEQISRDMDWAYAFSDRSPRSHSPYEYRQLDAGLPVDYRLRITREGITLPRALYQGQHLSLLLDQLYAPVLDISDFDQLPRPYRAVASDLVTGEQVVMDRGNLSTAVRASMSIPGLFEPVVWEDRLLVDGGIANNIPLDALADQQLDRLIVVDVGSPRRQAEDIQSMATVMAQLTALLVRNNSDRQLGNLAPQDVLITPDLEEVSNSDFLEVDAAINAGYAAAVLALDGASPDFNPAPDPLAGQAEDAADVALPRAKAIAAIDIHPRISFIEVDNDGPVSNRVVRAMLRQQLGERLDAAQLRDDISHIYALDYFGTIRYRLIQRNGETGLQLICRERTTSNSFVRFGLEAEDDFRGNATFGLSAGLRVAGLNQYGGVADFLVNVGTSPLVEARFYQPLDYKLRFFVEPLVGYRADDIEIYENNDFSKKPFVLFQRRESYFGMDIGATLFRQRGAARVGIRQVDGEFVYRSGLPVDGDEYVDGYYLGQLGWDTYDDLAFPSSGVRALAEYQYHDAGLGAVASYAREVVNLGIAHTFGDVSLVTEVSASLVEDDATPSMALVPVGGFLNLSGLPPSSRWGYHKLLGRMVAVTPIKRNRVLPDSLTVYVGASLEHGNVFIERDEIGDLPGITAGSVFLGTRTPLGPGYLAAGFAEGGEHSINLFFGHVFR